MSKIKRSVSLYSFQYQYLLGNYSLRDMFEKLKALGVTGVELIPDQMIRHTPEPSEESIQEWTSLCQEYEIEPVIADVFLNTNLYHNRELTPAECVDLLKKEIIMCSKLGFKKIRLVSMVPYYVIEPLLPVCEQYDMTLGLEIHAGLSFDKQKTIDFVNEMERLDSKYIGLVIDAGLFCQRIPRVMTRYFQEQGLTQRMIDYVDSVFSSGKDGRDLFVNDQLIDEAKQLATNEVDYAYAMLSSGYENESYQVLDKYKEKIIHIHGKIYEMVEDAEYSIDYPSFVSYLESIGYQGYISTEYEGNRWTLPGDELQEVENVERHQKLLKNLLEKEMN